MVVPSPSERKFNVSLSMQIKGESTSVKMLPWDPFATFNVAVRRAEGTNTTNKEIKSSTEGTPDLNKRRNQHGHIKCCKWVPWQHLDGS
jgi:hypothetical protein